MNAKQAEKIRLGHKEIDEKLKNNSLTAERAQLYIRKLNWQIRVLQKEIELLDE